MSVLMRPVGIGIGSGYGEGDGSGEGYSNGHLIGQGDPAGNGRGALRPVVRRVSRPRAMGELATSVGPTRRRGQIESQGRA